MTTQTSSVKRVKRKIKTSQNPLFEKWLKEWRDEAASKGSEMQYVFNKALKSLQKFPVRLYNGKECMVLENFGAKLCQNLDDKLEAYKASNLEGINVCPKSTKQDHSNMGSVLENVSKLSKKRKSNGTFLNKKHKISEEADLCVKIKTKSSSYVPAYRSGGYAILVAMHNLLQEDNFKGYLTKSEIEKHAEELCDSSFEKPLPGSYYTAWSSMAVLIKKKLVYKEEKPARFSLSQEGIDLAIKLKQIHGNLEKSNINFRSPQKCSLPQRTKKCLSPPAKRSEKQISPFKKNTYTLNPDKKLESVSEAGETAFMLPGTFEIVLLVDTQERDDKFQQADCMTMRYLKFKNVNFEIRHLKVGDFIWIARDLHNKFELVLPYIVERKRMDDLGNSIKDGRFHEQKFRLRQSGIENLIYLVEKYGNENQKLGLPLPTLMQAISNTQIVDGFTVRITNNHDHSMKYLDCMTTQMNNLFKSKTLMSCKKSILTPTNLSDDLISLMTFKDFNEGSEKNKKRTVRNMLTKHLIQLNGISTEKAQAIVQLYPTPKALMEGLKRATGEKCMANLTYGNFNRSIGPLKAKQIKMLYNSFDLR